MSEYYKENGTYYRPDWDSIREANEEKDNRTKQAYKDTTDINKILKKAATGQSLAHLYKYPEATYGEFNGEFDLMTAFEKIEKGNQIFAELPSEVRREFNNDALSFLKFAGDPKNNGKLAELLPAIAKPGDHFPNPVKAGGLGAGMATATANAEPPAVAASEPPADPSGDPPA